MWEPRGHISKLESNVGFQSNLKMRVSMAHYILKSPRTLLGNPFEMMEKSAASAVTARDNVQSNLKMSARNFS